MGYQKKSGGVKGGDVSGNKKGEGNFKSVAEGTSKTSPADNARNVKSDWNKTKYYEGAKDGCDE